MTTTRMGAPPRAVFVLPDGARVVGWAAAARAAGVSLSTLRQRVDEVDGVWIIRPPRRVGRPRKAPKSSPLHGSEK